MLSLYIVLQSVRFSDKFLFDIEVDTETDSFHIPSMVLQPTVQNVILHGFVTKESDTLTLKIEFYLKNQCEIVSIIEDNDVERNRSKKINGLKKLKKKSLGLQITSDRLKLHYKDKKCLIHML